ncbi:hypothetical protein A3Q34_19720 [Colwellia sp. PAMC 20917]|jgi:hypothetical protein|uniref:hypothetical protein n=1 Tax=unclassified Colwellia TaxID=196834 RepID=UPI000878DDD0|nr:MULTISPECIES: hypothetical protein [unclassified Colwellia]MBA6363846.1 hypothetical protein [Colwellia sp. BRX8-8]AOW78874.1 hypothetical protein A3Q34_19720 [Colwellia sp. PAMC 20917]MBA6338854.1 hypothetical protein [Colwellia sp. BRX8-7]MBA6350125.1 hypothetical protein [Colwellia sp. BRX8-9]MBA6353898.1 hypothetical protein [Colwellia sp. BRX9-1]
MPTNKHKRKASSHTKSHKGKNTESTGLIISHPQVFIYVGLFCVVLGVYLLAFESQDNALFGLAMLSLVAGVVTTFYANFTLSKKKAQLK